MRSSKIHEYPWIPQYPRVTRIVDIHAGTVWARISYLSNGVRTGIILSVTIDTHWHPYIL